MGIVKKIISLIDGRHDSFGKEHLDNTPVEVPLGYDRPETTEEIIARMIRADDFRRASERHGVESFEEANDFRVGDDYDPKSEYELDQDQYDADGNPFKPERPNPKPEVIDREKGKPDGSFVRVEEIGGTQVTNPKPFDVPSPAGGKAGGNAQFAGGAKE